MRTKRETPKETMAILKAARKKSRDEEIAAYGKPINHNSVVKSKKTYTRKVKHKRKEN